MSKKFRVAIVFLLALLSVPLLLAEGSLNGHVRNGTTGAPAANVPVVLIQLQGGMETVANTKTDSQGRFHFDNPAIGRQPMLVRAIYRGVNFHQPLPPGRDTADVEVFEPTADAKTIAVPSRLIVFQPNGSNLIVGEEYVVQNNSKPPAAFFKEKGNFEFHLPEHAELQQVAAWGPSGMPVVQGTMDKGANRYAIAFAFRPGESGVRLSYQMPYPSSSTVVRVASPTAAGRVVMVAPPTVTVRSTGFQPAGTEQGMNLYARETVPAGALFDVEVSGTAPAPAAQSGSSGGGVSQEQSDNRPIQTVPSRIDSLKWPLSGGFGALFLLGAIFLWRKSAASPANGAPGTVPSGAPAFTRGLKKENEISAHSAADIRQQVGISLDVLKDSLFRLELRHQAGTISDEEYVRERARVEQVLRELVKG